MNRRTPQRGITTLSEHTCMRLNRTHVMIPAPKKLAALDGVGTRGQGEGSCHARASSSAWTKEQHKGVSQPFPTTHALKPHPCDDSSSPKGWLSSIASGHEGKVRGPAMQGPSSQHEPKNTTTGYHNPFRTHMHALKPHPCDDSSSQKAGCPRWRRDARAR